MLNFFNRIFNIRRNEVGIIILISLAAFLTGCFLASFDIGTHTVFLNYFAVDNLIGAYIISGISGILLFAVYILFFKHLPFKAFTFINILLVALAVSVYEYHIHYGEAKIAAYSGFAGMFPVNAMILINFWYVVRNILLPEQRKRLFYLTQISLIGGIILGSYGNILLLFIYDPFISLLISTVSVWLLVIIFPLLFLAHHFTKHLNHQRVKKVPIKTGFFFLFSSKYTFWLFLFVLLSAIIGFTLHFLFISLTRASYPQIIGFSKFLGLFMGTLYLFVFGIEYVIIRKVLNSYDSPYSILLGPVAVGLITFVSVIVFFTLGYSTAYARFTFFFMMIGLTKLIYETVRFTIQNPSLRVLFMTLDIRFRQTIVPRLEGMIVMIGILVSGVLLYLLQQVKFLQPLNLTFFLFIAIIGWAVISVKLIRFYKQALQESIRKLKIGLSASSSSGSSLAEKIHNLINSNNIEKIKHTLSIEQESNPLNYEKHLINLITHPSNDIKEYSLKSINELSLIQALPVLKQVKGFEQPELTALVNQTIHQLEQKLRVADNKQILTELSVSHKNSDRIMATEVIGASSQKNYSNLLTALSRDFEPDVKLAAIRAMARLGNAEHSYLLIEYLSDQRYYPYAFDALVNIGEPALDHLEQVFYLPDADNTLLSRIIKIYGKINGIKATELLLNKIENQNRIIAEKAIAALKEAKYQAGSSSINKILNAAVRLISTMTWNFAALYSFKKSKRYSVAEEALKVEISNNYKTLFDLLSLAYNAKTISIIQNYIFNGDNTDISYAIEMLDHFIYEDIKQVLYPVLENITLKDRVKQLQYYFPLEKMEPAELISSIVVRDFNQISLYAKASCIQNYLRIKSAEVNQELVSVLFSPYKLLREISAFTINEKDSEVLENIKPRLEPGIIHEIEYAVQHPSNGVSYLLFDKINILKNILQFRNFSEETLIRIADAMLVSSLNKNEELKITGNKNLYTFILCSDGDMEIKIDNKYHFNLAKYDLFYPEIVDAGNSTIHFLARKNSTIYSIDKENLNSLIFDYADFMNMILDLMNNFKK